MQKPLFFLLLFLAGSKLLAQQHRLAAQPTTLGAGDTCTIQWQVPGSDSAYLSPVGPVGSIGKIRLPIYETTVIYLISYSKSGFDCDSIRISVTGQSGKGELDTLPNITSYEYPLSYYRKRAKPIQLIDDIFSLLQDTMGFSVAKTISSDSAIRFQTRLLKQETLKLSTDESHHILYRSISFLIDVSRTSDQDRYTVTIRSLIMYKNPLFPLTKEQQQSLYMNQNRKLGLMIK